MKSRKIKTKSRTRKMEDRPMNNTKTKKKKKNLENRLLMRRKTRKRRRERKKESGKQTNEEQKTRTKEEEERKKNLENRLAVLSPFIAHNNQTLNKRFCFFPPKELSIVSSAIRSGLIGSGRNVCFPCQICGQIYSVCVFICRVLWALPNVYLHRFGDSEARRISEELGRRQIEKVEEIQIERQIWSRNKEVV